MRTTDPHGRGAWFPCGAFVLSIRLFADGQELSRCTTSQTSPVVLAMGCISQNSKARRLKIDLEQSISVRFRRDSSNSGNTLGRLVELPIPRIDDDPRLG